MYRSIVVPYYRRRGVPLYDITASEEYNYTWFRIPKNGTHSIMQLLQEHAPPDTNSSWVPYPEQEHRGRFRFCVMRNPWDRLVSVYCNKVQMKLMYPECWDKDFTYFIDFVAKQDLRRCDGHIRLQTAMFPGQDIDFIARIENFEVDVKHVMEQIVKRSVTVPRIGAIAHDDYKAYYDTGLQLWVAKLYADDISFGGYGF